MNISVRNGNFRHMELNDLIITYMQNYEIYLRSLHWKLMKVLFNSMCLKLPFVKVLQNIDTGGNIKKLVGNCPLVYKLKEARQNLL